MVDVDGVEAISIFDFVVVRAPEPVSTDVRRRSYIIDGEILTAPVMTHVPRPPTIASYSRIGAIVWDHVFVNPRGTEENPAWDALLADLLVVVGPSVPVQTDPDNGEPAIPPFRLEDLSKHAVIVAGDKYYILPDTIEPAMHPWFHTLNQLADLTLATTPFDRAALRARVRKAFGTPKLSTLVFTNTGAHTNDYIAARRILFDLLYLLYLLRRWTSVDLGRITTGLRMLHLLQALAIDETYERALAAGSAVDVVDGNILNSLVRFYPQLANWNPAGVPGLPLIATKDIVNAYVRARPVLHPIFAQLFRFRRPFNRIKPLGVGDFKVVKQELVAYVPGEICDIHNVMHGETKQRVHRRLEKTEETFAFSGSTEEESTRDTQSTDRFELSREAESVLKTDLNINANANVTYDQKPVVATVSAGFAYARNDSTTEKIAQNFSREVVTKAVSRILTRVSEQRSITKIFETEEINTHTLAAPGGHVSGIYRWLDKRYRAQVFNFGKRMMFEFVLPEPAAFFVASRLRAYEATLNYPQKPSQPKWVELAMPVASPGEITRDKFNELRINYDLTAFSYPTDTKSITFVDTLSGASLLTENGIDGSDQWYSRALKCSIEGVTGYELAKWYITGKAQFDDHHQPPAESDRNLMRIEIDGTKVWNYEENNIYVTIGDRTEFAPDVPYLFTRDNVDVTLAFQDVELYRLMISADLRLADSGLLDWQNKVYQAILTVEKKAMESKNRDLKAVYDSALSTYNNRISELETSVLNDLLQGGAEAVNADLIRTELRRQCLAMITKEFATNAADDYLSKWNSMGERTVSHDITRINVIEEPKTSVTWKTTAVDTAYPVPDITVAQRKGKHIQFLEQAFDWDRIVYQFYPYFWSMPKRWIELMARSSDTDPTLTAFLRAGAVRVLLAVTPAYDDAVLHYLATREPWEGGASPAIGDPLFLPLHEELHSQQDDLYGARPEGKPWEFTIPTSLVYLHKSGTALPDLAAERAARRSSRGDD
jgi:hypothetical protein